MLVELTWLKLAQATTTFPLARVVITGLIWELALNVLTFTSVPSQVLAADRNRA